MFILHTALHTQFLRVCIRILLEDFTAEAAQLRALFYVYIVVMTGVQGLMRKTTNKFK